MSDNDSAGAVFAAWEYVVAAVVAIGGLFAAVMKALRPDYTAMAQAFSTERDRTDMAHRDAIVEAIEKLEHATIMMHADIRLLLDRIPR